MPFTPQLPPYPPPHHSRTVALARLCRIPVFVASNRPGSLLFQAFGPRLPWVVEDRPHSVAADWIGNQSQLPPLGKVGMVAISSIDQQTFRQLLSAATASQIDIGVESEWFADRDESIVGTVGYGGRFKGWGYAVLKRDTPDGFRVCVRHERFDTRHTARIMLLRQMAGTDAVAAKPLAA